MNPLSSLDHVLFGLAVGIAVRWLGRLPYSRPAIQVQPEINSVFRLVIAGSALTLATGSLVLLLGADGAQDGLLAADVRLRNVGGAVLTVLIGALGWFPAPHGRSSHRSGDQ